MPCDGPIDDDEDDDFDEGNIGMPDANWWKTQASPEFFAQFKRHPMTLRFHPELYEEGERERIWEELKASGSPTDI